MAGYVVDQWMHRDPASGKKVKTERHGHGKRWLARWPDPITASVRARAFSTKDDAEAFLARIQVQGAEWVDPRRGRKALREFAERWYATKVDLTPNTLAWYRGLLDTHILPDLGERPIGALRRADLQAYIAGKVGQLSPARRGALQGVLAGIFDIAVQDRALTTNPVRGVRKPSIPQTSRKALTAAQLAALITSLETHGEAAACFALVLAFSGIRFGEAAGLVCADLVGNRLAVEGAIATVGGKQHRGTTKGHRERAVALPKPVAQRVRELTAGMPADAPLLPAPKGGHWHHGSWMRIWRRAIEEAGLVGTVPHELRHTGVSLAIASGADVKVVQQMVGHKYGSLTIDTYGHFFEDRLDEVADALEQHVPKRRARLRAVE